MRKNWLPAASVGAVALVIGVFIAGYSSAQRNCSAVGWAYIGPVELRPEVLSADFGLSACFSGPECIPQAVHADANGRWLVPQDAPFLSRTQRSALNLSEIHVRVTDASGTVADRMYQIPTRRLPGGDWPSCPGPFEYLPVTVP